MTKDHIFKRMVIMPALLVSAHTFAHTINQNMEQMYGTSYLPLFVCARLLPFIGLGLLAYDTQKGKFFQIRWPFFIALIFGIALGLVWHGGQFISMINTIGILAIGLVLLFTNNPSNKYVLALFLVLGTTIGYENGLFVAHSIDFRWMYLSILGSGICAFLVLNNIHFIGHPKRRLILNIAGIVFILSGVFLVLMS